MLGQGFKNNLLPGFPADTQLSIILLVDSRGKEFDTLMLGENTFYQ